MKALYKKRILVLLAATPYLIWFVFGIVIDGFSYIDLNQIVALIAANIVMIALVISTIDSKSASKLVAAIMIALVVGYLIFESNQQHPLLSKEIYYILIGIFCTYYVALNILSLTMFRNTNKSVE